MAARFGSEAKTLEGLGGCASQRRAGLADQFGHIRDDAERIGCARAAAKHGVGFLLAKFVGIAGILIMLVGLGLGAAAFFI